MYQGAVTPFIDGHGLRKGNNRLAFAPDGSLWVGQTDDGWLGDRGIQRISFTSKIPFNVENMQLLEDGFEIFFTQPTDLETAVDITGMVRVRRYNYHYHEKYGSEEINVKQQRTDTLLNKLVVYTVKETL